MEQTCARGGFPQLKVCRRIVSLLIAGEDAEIIIVNDGSNKDNTAEIADNYQKDYPSIIKVIHKENGGHGDAVTVGIKMQRENILRLSILTIG